MYREGCVVIKGAVLGLGQGEVFGSVQISTSRQHATQVSKNRMVDP